MLHIPLVFPHIVQAAQVFIVDQPDCNIHDIDMVAQVVFDNLFPAPGQFVQVQKADRADRFHRILMRAPAQLNRSAYQYDCQNDDPRNCNQCNMIVPSVLHIGTSSCLHGC